MANRDGGLAGDPLSKKNPHFGRDSEWGFFIKAIYF